MIANAQTALSQYKQANIHGNAASASPHRLVQLLMDSALTHIASAKGMIQRGKTAEKAANLSRASEIIDGLRMSLDRQAGGDIAVNLDNLYDYMGRRLLEANLRNKTEVLDEVHALLAEIKSAWDAIGDGQFPHQPAAQDARRGRYVPMIG